MSQLDDQSKIVFKRLLRLLAITLLFGIAVLLIKYKLTEHQQHYNSKRANQKLQQIMQQQTDFRDIKPELGEPIGSIKLAQHTGAIPIIEGTDLTLAMASGIGHVPHSALPGANSRQQIILSGHRETFFAHLKDLTPGEIITIKMPYHTYRYQVTSTKIVQENEASKVYKNGLLAQDELVLFTCYPFSPFSKANQRYVVFAHPYRP